MAKFLILGANSFYGKYFAHLTQKSGDEIDLFYRPQFDLNVDKTWRWLRQGIEEKPDYIVNFISQSLVEESWGKPADWIFTNVISTTRLFEHLREFKGTYIHVSTPEVYGSMEGWGDERSKWNPSTPYAVTRAAGEMMLMAYAKAYGFKAIITRTANIYGKWQPKHRIIPKAFACKLGGHTLGLHGSGTSVRSFIHVRDACEATRLICLGGRAGETYHISTNQSHSIREVVEMIGCPWEPAPERLGKDHAYLLNSDKLRAMGWKDTISLEEGLKECASAH